MQARFVAAVDEAPAAATLAVDQAEVGVLALVMLQLPAPTANVPHDAPPPAALSPAPPPGDPLSSSSATAAVHAATSLRPAPRPGPPPDGRSAIPALPANSLALPPPQAAASERLVVIASRRSVRRFAAAALPLDALSGVLAAMTTRHPPILSAAVRIDVVVHAVATLSSGAYRYDAARHALVPRRVPAGLRAAARAAALDQDVVGAGAAAFVLSIDRSALGDDPLGAARGYRHAFIEAGLMGERLYLEAGARGLGACAVGAFYDDEAAALVGVDPAREWVVHFAALGVPQG
jgi:SagB-type dehydrogenase family enzyme